MTEQQYHKERARWVGQALNINPRFFPLTLKARLRQIAHLDAQWCGDSFQDHYKELLLIYNVTR